MSISQFKIWVTVISLIASNICNTATLTGLEKRDSCALILQQKSGIIKCPFALFPDAHATLSCPSVASEMIYEMKNEIGSIDAAGLFQVNKTFAVADGADEI